MNSRIVVGVIGFLVVLGLFVAITCTYVVDEREQVVVTRFSKPVRVIVGGGSAGNLPALAQKYADEGSEVQFDSGPGLKFKAPFIDRVETFPDTQLEYDADPQPVYTKEEDEVETEGQGSESGGAKELIVDNFARWHIDDPLLFRVRVQTEVRARERLDDLIYSIMREEIGRMPLIEVIRTTNRYIEGDENLTADVEPQGFASGTNPMRQRIDTGREELMTRVQTQVNERALEQYGISVTDVRIKRAELVASNLSAVFERMRADRERLSKAYRSEGEKDAEIIRGETDRQVKVMLAEAGRDAEEMRGEADAEVMRIFADAFGTNPALYRFIRSLEVLKGSMAPGTELILSADSGIFQVLKGDLAGENEQAPRRAFSSPAASATP
jgi:modulator of FtsH protease HflC